MSHIVMIYVFIHNNVEISVTLSMNTSISLQHNVGSPNVLFYSAKIKLFLEFSKHFVE